MTATEDRVALDQWYALGAMQDFRAGEEAVTRLLGEDVRIRCSTGGDIAVTAGTRKLPIRTDYGHLWTSLGSPARPVFDLPESREPDRRAFHCGPVRCGPPA